MSRSESPHPPQIFVYLVSTPLSIPSLEAARHMLARRVVQRRTRSGSLLEVRRETRPGSHSVSSRPGTVPSWHERLTSSFSPCSLQQNIIRRVNDECELHSTLELGGSTTMFECYKQKTRIIQSICECVTSPELLTSPSNM